MQTLLSGPEALQSLPQKLFANEVLLLTYGRGSENPYILQLLEAWDVGAIVQIPFSTPLLQLEQIAEIAETIRGMAYSPDLILSIGGGAVLDLAKCLKLMLDCNLSGEELLTAPHSWERDTLHVAVPTTAGTGSEATCFATVYRGETKFSAEDPRLRPGIAVLDPLLMFGLEPRTAIATGFDALAQAMESVWSIHANEESIGYACEAIPLIRASFQASVQAPSTETLHPMQTAAYLSGKAIHLSRTTLAHALSYFLSARFHLPHGLAVILTLPAVIRFNGAMNPEDCLDPRGYEHYRNKMNRLFSLCGVHDHEELACFVEEWMRTMGIPTNLAEHGIPNDQMLGMIESAAASNRAGNNPRRIDRETLARALR